METVVVKRPSREIIPLVEVECFVQEGKTVCAAPPDYKCHYRRIRPVSDPHRTTT